MKVLVTLFLVLCTVADAITIPLSDLLSAFNVLTTPHEIVPLGALRKAVSQKINDNVAGALKVSLQLAAVAPNAKNKVLQLVNLVANRNVEKPESDIADKVQSAKVITTVNQKPFIELVTSKVFLPAAAVVPDVARAIKHKSQRLVQKANMLKLAKQLRLVEIDELNGDASKFDPMRYQDERDAFETMKVLTSILEKLMREGNTSGDDSDGTDSESKYRYDSEYENDQVESDWDSDDDDNNYGDYDDYDDCDDYWYYLHHVANFTGNGTNITRSRKKSRSRNSTNSLGWRVSTVWGNYSIVVHPDKVSSSSAAVLVRLYAICVAFALMLF